MTRPKGKMSLEAKLFMAVVNSGDEHIGPEDINNTRESATKVSKRKKRETEKKSISRIPKVLPVALRKYRVIHDRNDRLSLEMTASKSSDYSSHNNEAESMPVSEYSDTSTSEAALIKPRPRPETESSQKHHSSSDNNSINSRKLNKFGRFRNNANRDAVSSNKSEQARVTGVSGGSVDDIIIDTNYNKHSKDLGDQTQTNSYADRRDAVVLTEHLPTNAKARPYVYTNDQRARHFQNNSANGISSKARNKSSIKSNHAFDNQEGVNNNKEHITWSSTGNKVNNNFRCEAEQEGGSTSKSIDHSNTHSSSSNNTSAKKVVDSKGPSANDESVKKSSTSIPLNANGFDVLLKKEPFSDDELKQEQLQELTEAFSHFDRNGDGALDSKELINVMRSVGMNPSEVELMEIFANLDIDGDGKVELHEFLTIMMRRNQSLETAAEIKNVFRVFDRDGNGFINAGELKYMMCHCLGNVTDEEVDELMSFADIDGDGRINYDEFVHLMMVEGEGEESLPLDGLLGGPLPGTSTNPS